MRAWQQAYQKLVIQEPEPGLLEIILDNPRRLNAVDTVTHAELSRVWRDIDTDETVRVVLIRGAGNAFSAGGDFAMVEQILRDPVVRMRVWKEARDLVYNIINCNKPIVSAIQGPAVGAGLAAALLADISVAGHTAKLVDGHVRLGVPAGDHAAIIWPLLIGMARAKYYLMLNEPISGAEAGRIGLVSLAVADDKVLETAMGAARRLAASSPAAVRWTKYALNNWLRMQGPVFDASTALEFLGFTLPDAAEGLAALREKRDPKFADEAPL